MANDRSYKALLYNRFILFLLLVLAQVAVQVGIWVSVVYKSPVGSVLQLLLWVLSLLFVLHVINKNERPSLKINWIIILLLAPVFGVPFYLLYGDARPTKKMRKKLANAKAEVCQSVRGFYGEREGFAPSTREEGIAYFLEKQAGYPLFRGGDVSYYESGEAAFPHILSALKSAETFILLEYFIIKHGKMWAEILQILLEKAEQGVQIRIIYDDFGCMMSLPPKYERYLEGLHKNIRCMKFNSVVPILALRMNNRDHRKILVIDGKIAFTGGINLADEYINAERRFGYWKDSALKITGDAVSSFTQMFFYLWNAFRKDKEDVKRYLLPRENEKGGGQVCVQPYDDSPLDEIRVGETVYMDAIARAQKSLYIFTPYLILDDEMRTALCQAALRGVDVRIVTPSVPDKKLVFRMTRANYGILLKAGVKIYEYSPGFIHAKSVLCDEKTAVVGTVNFDYRSLYFHFENAVCFSNCQAVEDLKRDCESTFAVSKECTLENTKRNMFGRLIDALFRVFETLL